MGRASLENTTQRSRSDLAPRWVESGEISISNLFAVFFSILTILDAFFLPFPFFFLFLSSEDELLDDSESVLFELISEEDESSVETLLEPAVALGSSFLRAV